MEIEVEDEVERIKKMLDERFGKDKLRIKNLDYPSWELGFQRGMEYQMEMDKRVLNLEKGAKGFLMRLVKARRGEDG